MALWNAVLAYQSPFAGSSMAEGGGWVGCVGLLGKTDECCHPAFGTGIRRLGDGVRRLGRKTPS